MPGTEHPHRSLREVLIRSAYALLGVMVIGAGAAILLDGGVGVDPFTALNTGIADHLGWTLGSWQLVANLVLLVAVVLWGRRYIGLGTIINMVLTGYFITWFAALFDPLIPDELGMGGRALFFVIGIAVFDFGASAYMSAGVGTAPYDAIAPIIVDRTGWTYRWVRAVQDLLCVAAGVAVGGAVGAGTIATAFFNGPLIQVYSERVNSVLVARLVDAGCGAGTAQPSAVREPGPSAAPNRPLR